QDAPLGGRDARHEKPLRRGTEREVWLAEEHPARERDRPLDRRADGEHPDRLHHRRWDRRNGGRRSDRWHRRTITLPSLRALGVLGGLGGGARNGARSCKASTDL